MMPDHSCPLCQTPKGKKLLHNYPDRKLRHYWQCSSCCLISLDPQHHLDPVQEKARYDLHRNHSDDTRYVDFLKRLAEPMIRNIKAEGCGLDFGCGPGPTMREIFRQKGFDVVNYDPYYFPDSLHTARAYDFITCSEVVEHFYSPREEFLRLKGLMNGPGSLLGIMTQVFDSKGDFKDWWYRKDPTHVSFYQKETFEWIGRWLGWSVDFPTDNVILFRQ